MVALKTSKIGMFIPSLISYAGFVNIRMYLGNEKVPGFSFFSFEDRISLCAALAGLELCSPPECWD